MSRWVAPITILLASTIYWFAMFMSDPVSIAKKEGLAGIVLPAPVQVFLYGGDRFLAANVEQIRGAAQMTQTDSQDFRLRAYSTVSILNPCHEDNYWLGNATLSWGGAVSQGLSLLRNASQCRFWDEWPPFFYAFSQNFFLQNVDEAQRFLEIAAQRSPINAPGFRTYATMLGVNRIKNTRMALKMLENEKRKARSPELKEMLGKRVDRLKGLIILQNAQQKYEEIFGHPLKNPMDLLSSGVLDEIPNDPLRLGYELRNGQVYLRELKAGG